MRSSLRGALFCSPCKKAVQVKYNKWNKLQSLKRSSEEPYAALAHLRESLCECKVDQTSRNCWGSPGLKCFVPSSRKNVSKQIFKYLVLLWLWRRGSVKIHFTTISLNLLSSFFLHGTEKWRTFYRGAKLFNWKRRLFEELGFLTLLWKRSLKISEWYFLCKHYGSLLMIRLMLRIIRLIRISILLQKENIGLFSRILRIFLWFRNFQINYKNLL